MKAHSHSLRVALSLVALALGGAAGCLCPPCGPPPGVGPAAGEGAKASGPVAAGARLVIWDGDSEAPTAAQWNGCGENSTCKAKIEATAGVGINGSTALKFHGEGTGWIGMGWNLFGWYPENSGYDISPYTHLTFQIRVDAKTPADAPETGGVTVALGCSAKKDFGTASVPLEKYAKGFTDGKWHKVSIPLPAFQKGEGAKFDMQSFWEFRVFTWSGATHNFDIIIDDLVAEKH